MDIKNLCRLCLSRDDKNLMWVFDDRLECTKYAKKLITKLVGVEINKDDVISQKICVKCGENVIKLYHFREQSLRSDKILKELYRSSKKKTMHKSVINLYKKYPGLKLPNAALDLNFSPMVEMEMDGVQNYFKSRKINMEKHVQQVLRSQIVRAKCISKDSTPSKDTVSPISIKFVQNTSSYEIIQKTNEADEDGRLQQEIINLISSPVPDPNLSSSHRKRRNSTTDVDTPPPIKKAFDKTIVEDLPVSSKNSKGIFNSSGLRKGPEIISNILLGPAKNHTILVNKATEQTNNQNLNQCEKLDSSSYKNEDNIEFVCSRVCNKLPSDRCLDSNLSCSNIQSNQITIVDLGPEKPNMNECDKLDSSIYKNINGIKPLPLIVTDKKSSDEISISYILQSNRTNQIHSDSEMQHVTSLLRSSRNNAVTLSSCLSDCVSKGATEPQVPIVDSTSPNSPPVIIENMSLDAINIRETLVDESDHNVTSMTSHVITTTDEPNPGSHPDFIDTNACSDNIELDLNLGLPLNESSTLIEVESKIEVSSPQVIDLISKDLKRECLSPFSNIKLRDEYICKLCNKKHATAVDLREHVCIDQNYTTDYSSPPVTKKLEVSNNEHSNNDSKNAKPPDIVLDPEIIEILSDDEDQDPSLITSSIMTPNIAISDNKFNINWDDDSVNIINQILNAIIPTYTEHGAQTNLTYQDPELQELKENLKIVPKGDSICTKSDSPQVELQSFKPFLDIYQVPVIIINENNFSVKYSVDVQVKPKNEYKHWNDLKPVDIAMVQSDVKQEPSEADDDRILDTNPSEQLITYDSQNEILDIKPEISECDNTVTNVAIISEMPLVPAVPPPVFQQPLPQIALPPVSKESLVTPNNGLQIMEQQTTQEITLNDPTKQLELDIDLAGTISLNTEELANYLDSIVPTSICNNEPPVINFPHQPSVSSTVEGNIRNLLQSRLPVVETSFSNQTISANLPSESFPSLPDLGLNVEPFDSYIQASVPAENVSIQTNTYINSHTNLPPTQEPNILSNIPQLPFTSLASQTNPVTDVKSNAASRYSSFDNMLRNMLDTNTETKKGNNTNKTDSSYNLTSRINNNLHNNSSNSQHHINLNLNVYNNNSYRLENPRPRRDYFRDHQNSGPVVQNNTINQHRRPPPAYTPIPSDYPQQACSSNAFQPVHSDNNYRNYTSNVPYNNYRQFKGPQADNCNQANNYYPYGPPNINPFQRNRYSNNSNSSQSYHSQRMESLTPQPIVRNHAGYTRSMPYEHDSASVTSNASTIRVRSMNDLKYSKTCQ